MDHEKINKTAIETNDKLKFVNFNHAELERKTAGRDRTDHVGQEKRHYLIIMRDSATSFEVNTAI